MRPMIYKFSSLLLMWVDGSFRFSTFFLRVVWVKKAKVRAIRVDDPQFLPVIDNTK